MASPSDPDSPPQVLGKRAGRINRYSAKISVNWNGQELDIPTAFAKNPKKIREELLEAIRQVELEESDINLLLMERIFKSALKRPGSVTAEQMMGALESFRPDDPNSIGSLFYEHGRIYGIAIFVLATSVDSGLPARLEQLPRKDQILLVRRLTDQPPRDLSNFLSDCAMPKTLQRLRDGGSGKYRCLWIDSLCIDQTNNKDRNHQVASMGRIYENAQIVLVWLGEHSSDSGKAIDFITFVFNQSWYHKYGSSSSYTYEGNKKFESSEWQAVDSLFRRDYWERTWIIQEIQLASSVLVYCGDRTFDWSAGKAFFDFLQGDHDRHLETDPESVATKQSVMQSPAMQLLESALLFRKRDMTLKQLLYRHENSLCRESRDKIYGLLALASDCKQRKFEPDYEKDLSEVYRDALRLEMTTSFSGQHISPDFVHYSHLLQRILNLFLAGPHSLIAPVARDPVCVLGYSCGRLREVDVEYQNTSASILHVFNMFDSEFLIHKGPEPPLNNAFGYILDPRKAPIPYTWLEPPGLEYKPGCSRTWSFDHQSLKRSPPPGLKNNPSSPQQIATMPFEPPATKTFILPKGQTVLVPEVAQAGDEICMFSKHDMAIILREDEAGKWQVMGNALVLTTEEKRSRRPRKDLRSFQYCLPDYDIFPPPTSDPQNSFYIRMSTMTLQWMTRAQTSRST
ncbi:hypothetical protein N431DRAFT_563623 [Stipitochalara longipes BDJ]|nr:hypothetical protein N431DRAFT_563623 [Stipitochalara longipes BDJ]